jgi:hypothetical protein
VAQDVDWSAAFPAQPLSVPLRAFGQLLDALAAERAELDAAAAAHQLPEDVPDDFLDPITMELMREPVTLPDSQIVVDRCVSACEAWVRGAGRPCLSDGHHIEPRCSLPPILAVSPQEHHRAPPAVVSDRPLQPGAPQHGAAAAS